MKRLITLSIIMSSAFGAYAQDVEGRVTLDEVTVKAAKVVNKADGMIISYRCSKAVFQQWLQHS